MKAQNKLTTVRLESAPMIHTPGLLYWATHNYKYGRGSDAIKMTKLISDSFGLTQECAALLLSGQIKFSVEGDSVVFDYYGQPMK